MAGRNPQAQGSKDIVDLTSSPPTRDRSRDDGRGQSIPAVPSSSRGPATRSGQSTVPTPAMFGETGEGDSDSEYDPGDQRSRRVLSDAVNQPKLPPIDAIPDILQTAKFWKV